MQDKRSALQAHVDKREKGQNNSINIESIVAMLFKSKYNVADETGELRLHVSLRDP